MYRYTGAVERTPRSEIRELLKVARSTNVISFGGGLPDKSLFPIEDLKQITADLLTNRGFLALQYGATEGDPDFIGAIVNHSKSFGETVAPENICVVSSSQQGIDLLTHILVEHDDVVIVEYPTYLGVIQAFQRAGANMIGVKMDNEGIMPDELEKAIASAPKKPKFIYIIPDFQNPTGINMSLERRKKIIEIGKKHDIPIVEDSPYREMNFTGKNLPSLWSLSGGTGIITFKTMSKMLFPGMRLGWVVAEKEVVQNMVKIKQSVDLCTSSFNQLIIAQYMNSGKLHDTINKAIELYKGKKELMVSELAKNMPEGVSWTNPDGGMFLWMTLPQGYSSKDLFMISAQKGAIFVTGNAFHCDGKGINTLRLNYSFPTHQQIKDGIKILGDSVKELLKK
jgi:2-aminoadipate transaminase